MDLNKYKGFCLRKAKPEDKDLLYRWANDPLTRQNAFNMSQISYEDHEKWFENTINSKKRIQLILEKNREPIGQIRFDIEDDIGEIDYSIAPEYRGNGYGTLICDLAVLYSKEYLKINKIIAQVKTSNMTSKQCFLKNGFNAVFEQFELII